MRTFTIFSALALLVGAAAAQFNITQLLQELQSLGLTSLVNITSVVNQTATGKNLLSQLGLGPVTVFAPNDNAWSGAYSNVTSSAQVLSEILSYHVLPGTFNTTATFPNTTVGRTLLNSSDLVFLEGGKRQVLAWSDLRGTPTILNQNTPCHVVNQTSVGNVTLLVTDAVIDVPGDLVSAIDANSLTAFNTALQQGNLLSTLNLTHGVTIFAPTDAAFARVRQNLTDVANNSTLLSTILQNHVISGTSVYSGNLIGLGGSNLTTAAGEGLQSTTNSSGTFVTVGNSTARIRIPDLLLWNGVVHVVDNVFLDEESDPSAASSALSSATSAATASTTESGPIGFTPTSAASGTAFTNTASSAAMSAIDIPFAQFGLASVMNMLGLVFGAVLAL